jgi:co-chaperonin GroES (HSP10)
MSNFVPLGQRILVEDILEKYIGRLVLPPTSPEKPTFQSKVIAISGDIINCKFAVGDTIYRSQWIGQIIDVEKNHRVMNISDVLGKLE